MSAQERPQRRWMRQVIETPEPPPAAPAPVMRTFIDPGAVFEGTLRLREDLRIECEFRGRIDCEGTLVVGPTGCVEGDIRAREVEISGAVVGNVVAPRQLVLRAGARLHGDVETACLEIEKHAFFNGRTVMVQPLAALRAQTEPRAPEPAPADPVKPLPL
jgi:cytoskeletal protein CcmA (bactofilin family)